jgi:hypothetical protein
MSNFNTLVVFDPSLPFRIDRIEDEVAKKENDRFIMIKIKKQTSI